MVYRFGPFRADRSAYRVFRGGEPMALTPKLLDLLFFLLDRPAALVTKEALLDGVWPGANVTDNALAQAVSELRDALGDRAASPTYIRTVARRGYRFVAPVETEAPASAAPAAAAAPAGARTIAVLDFTNVTGDADVAWLSAGIAETVSSDLARLAPFRVIDRRRVRQAALDGGADLQATGAALGAALVATGSFQRRGPHLRISARIVDLARGETIADAKVDGQLDEVFALQDAVVAALARELGLLRSPQRAGGHETSSLDAYRAYTEGYLKVETLDTSLTGEAIADFTRAIAADPGFAQAYAGLANAEFVAYEMTRQTAAPDAEALASGIEHAQRAIDLAPDLAEAHATLSFLLTSAARPDEAHAAARRAAALEPENWRHQYRLGHATWGAARLSALERALALYPQFAYARLEMAMVHIARGQLDRADALVRRGAADQDRQAAAAHRFPGVGFHWLLGALHAARDRHDDAVAEFDRELDRIDRRRLYGPEYGVFTLYWKGCSELALGRPERARATFHAAHQYIDGHPRAWLGEASALARLGDARGASALRARVEPLRTRDRLAGRAADAYLIAAIGAAESGDAQAALGRLAELLDLPVGPGGWSIPIEPAFRPLQASAGFTRLLTRLADRAA
jgi:DNA-binding winged helix-turn-helix (wHTH) protein/tetratricopeptide (TPR) repeat protein